MEVFRSEHELRAWLDCMPPAALGLVPTMGALHEGHMSLVRRARAENERVGASIFVNPLQFGPNDDLARYPRTEAEDLRQLGLAGADVVLVGQPEDLYPPGFATAVEVGAPVTAGGEAAVRPGHFRGVATVVAKLFGMFAPRRAYFGWKDMQQVCVVRRLVRDLSLGVTVVPCETCREPDGLAMSSRNRYLSTDERRQAAAIYQALRAAREAWRRGERHGRALADTVARQLRPGFEVDYVEVRDEADYALVADPVTRGRLVVAARLGKTRLLDNLALDAPDGELP